MTPKGKLLIVGGHEEKGETAGENLDIKKSTSPTTHFKILGSLICDIPRAHHHIEIIASASAIPKEMEDLYINSYKAEGFTHVGIIKVENKADAHDPESIKRVHSAHAVFFTGGDQEQLVARLANTKLMDVICGKYFTDKNFIVGGTSAGAMSMPETIIVGGVIREALFKNDIKMAKGFDLIKNVIVDTHFIKRGRFARLAHAVALNPSCLGIGLGEDTALIISEGHLAECIGSGMVIFIDPSHITSTNISSAEHTTPITMENLIVSIIAEGSRYSLKEKKGIA